MEGLTAGRIVHYVLPHGANQGEHRPAIIVRVWDQETGAANLQVFMDGVNDNMGDREGTDWQTSIVFDPDETPNTWHWIEKA